PLGERGFFEVETELPDAEFTAFYYNESDNEVLLGMSDGRVALLKIDYEAKYPADAPRRIEPEIQTEVLEAFGEEGVPVSHLSLYESDRRRVVGMLQHAGDTSTVRLQTYSAENSLFGESEMKAEEVVDLSGRMEGNQPREILIGGRGDRIFLTTDEGFLYYFRLQGADEIELLQKLRPFKDESDPAIASIDWLLGKQTAILTSVNGTNATYASYRDKESGNLIYTKIKDFPALAGGGATDFSPSQRNRGFLLANKNTLSLRYSTTEQVRWETNPDYNLQKALIGPRWKSIMSFDDAGRLHHYKLNDPHPEGGFRTFFTKIWYEGKSEPEYEWQSSGSTSEFEPKLSIVPLFFGSIKGTIYAMLFALPIAILAAVYTSQFLKPEVKRYIKPAMEIMASLPSVVLGFLAALWLAPILHDRVPSIIMMLVFLPVSAALIGGFWGHLPQYLRNAIKPGSEWLVLIPLILIIGYIGWQLGPVLEALVFRVYDPDVGAKVGNFQEWWTEHTGNDYQQRNCLVVGIMMGFAVIPIIFTISEDALSNVPPYLKSASTALGASRWQTTWRIILPTASPGIFSASIIGFGRAVGETMIFLMATGNTPIMDWNIFNGMRTLAANIAVELPEAPQYSTLYRTLLFLLTFLINTVAEIVRQHLREKYKTV
ncbi:MAG: ABC transporter permease subunit, partial [Opitutales bacterium]